jgi:hypothetical protein
MIGEAKKEAKKSEEDKTQIFFSPESKRMLFDIIIICLHHNDNQRKIVRRGSSNYSNSFWCKLFRDFTKYNFERKCSFLNSSVKTNVHLFRNLINLIY